MKLMISVCSVPCAEEYYMGVDAEYRAHTIDIPDSIVPSNILDIAKGKVKDKRITNIILVDEND